jgi:Histidine kinase-, DNA gyrase B-, and HSP90-like ATPase
MATENDKVEFSGKVLVASRIVDFLSSGLYNSPAACLKELINNSYDADASFVRVFVKPEADSIIIEDDGSGLTKSAFISHFSRVSESAKRDSGDVTEKLRRKKIGLIGIGFIAANEICEEMEIVSSVKGEAARLRVTVDFRAMRLSDQQRRQGDVDYQKGDFYGTTEPEELEAHYTRIFLNEIRGEAREIMLSVKRAVTDKKQGISLYGLKPQSVRNKLATPPRSWSDLDKYSQSIVEIGLNVPVQYLPDWLPEQHRQVAAPFTKRAAKPKFRVEYDGSDLRKPTVLVAARERSVFKPFQLKGKRVSASGYFFAGRGTLMPNELNGVLIRIREAAVGAYDPAFLGYPRSVSTLIQRWVTAEVWASDDLEDAMNIDRRTLREAHEAFVELQAMFHVELDQFLSEVRRELYSEPAAERRHKAARRQEIDVERTVKRALPKSRRVSDALPWTASPVDGSKKSERPFLRTFTVAELYEIVVEAAEASLDANAREAFMVELGSRLRKRR